MSPSKVVNIALMNGNTLNVSIENPLSDIIINERQAKALQIARIAYSSYPSRESLSAVNVMIVNRRRYLFVLPVANNMSFHFTKAELIAEAA